MIRRDERAPETLIYERAYRIYAGSARTHSLTSVAHV